MTASKPKTPSPSGISRLLAAAGFERAVVTSRGRHHPVHSEGFHVKTFLGEVIVTWWPESGRHLASQHQEDVVRGREMRARYAEAIRSAGWPLVEEKAGSLIVTAKTED